MDILEVQRLKWKILMFNNSSLNTFSFTKSKWKRYPIIETLEMDDYSVVEKYKSEYPYVWIKHKEHDILETFNWNYTPNDDTANQIHIFPLCNELGKRPIDWQVLKLVPTTVNSSTAEHKSPNIASYQKNIIPIYFYSFKNRTAVKKFKHRMEFFDHTHCHLINDKESFDEVLYSIVANVNIAQPIWLVNLDVNIENLDMLSPKYANNLMYAFGADIFLFDVMHKSTNQCYADTSVALINPGFLAKLSNNVLKSKTSTESTLASAVVNPIHKQIGYLDDVTDPYRAWANAYLTCLMLNNTKLPHLKKQKNKILSTYLELSDTNVNRYVTAGLQQASKDQELDTFNFNEYTIWSNIFKRFTEWNNTSSTQTPKLLDRRRSQVKKVYGENSDQYQKLSSQLGKSSL